MFRRELILRSAGVLTAVYLSPLIGLGPNILLAEKPAVHMANGVKIGEVTSTSAVIWVRLTQASGYKKDGLRFTQPDQYDTQHGKAVYSATARPVDGYCRQVSEGHSLDEMQTAVPGAAGECQLVYWKAGDKNNAVTSDWVAVDGNRDFSRQFPLRELQPGTRYHYRMQGRAPGSGQAASTVENSFRTAPAAEQAAPVVFTVVTGQRWNSRDDERGQKIYPSMSRLEPGFFVHTGDIVYYDSVDPWVTHIDLARFKWNRTYAQLFLREFHNHVPSYFIKDDHDSWQNDDWPSMSVNRMGVFTWEQGRNVFLEQVPMGKTTYRTIRWGKDLQVWLVEGRDFRSPNDMPDGPDKTIWGQQQLEWFKRTVSNSDASFRVLISPTPVLGPDHRWKEETADNHVASRRTHEGSLVRQFLAQQKNMYIVCGDRHWQYVSQRPDTNLTEYSCGPTTDKHATTLKNDDHRMLKYIRAQGGFLSVSTSRKDGLPGIAFRHHDVEGNVTNEHLHWAGGR